MERVFCFYLFPVLLLIGAGGLLTVVVLCTMQLLKVELQTRLKTLSVLAGIFLALAVAELTMRLTGIMATQTEKRLNDYWSPYNYNRDKVLWNWDPNKVLILEGPEFSYARKINALGFDDAEFCIHKDSGEIRILTLGDSFTEGDGAAYDSSYPRQLEDILTERYASRKIVVMNAGICGSDPMFNFKAYDSLLYKYRPDLVIQVFSTQDVMNDMALRGGLDRFTPDGKVNFTHHFALDKVFMYSRLSRLYFVGIRNLNEHYLNDEILLQKRDYLLAQTRLLFSAWQQQVVNRGFKFYVVYRPDPMEIEQHSYGTYMQPFINNIDSMGNSSKLFKTIDLISYYTQVAHMDKDAQKYFWPIDRHHNATGYHQMAMGIAEGVKGDLDAMVMGGKQLR
jgi:hypothetical protein